MATSWTFISARHVTIPSITPFNPHTISVGEREKSQSKEASSPHSHASNAPCSKETPPLATLYFPDTPAKRP